jgi:hypothetical protein
MGLFNTIWSELKIGYDKAYRERMNDAMSTLDLRYRKSKNGVLVYKSHAAYKSVFEFISRQSKLQYAERTLNSLWPKYIKSVEETRRKYALAQQDANRAILIAKGQAIDSGLGAVTTTEGNYTYIAKDKYGSKVPDAIMVYYDVETPISVSDNTAKAKRMIAMGVDADEDDFMGADISTRTICFIDLAPEVTLSSSKNIVLTNVQGRDYSRKELIAGGDLKFSVSGNIVYDEPDIYPENDVKKFIQMMEYNGIIHVNHRMFRQFGVTSIIVQDFNLGKPDFKNMQPYSFNCVAVEPDEAVVITQDTIGTINHDIAVSPVDGWMSIVLGKKRIELNGDNKYIQMGANAATGAAMGALGSLTDLVPNI